MDPSFSASGSRHSLDSMDGSFGKDNYSPQGSFLIGRQDSTGSQTGSSYGSYSFHDSARANYSSLNSKVASTVSRTQNHRDDSNRASRTVPASPLRNSGSFKDLETAEATIEELRAEAKMWEQNARKLVIDMEKLQKDLYDQSKCQESLEMELSASRTQCNGLKQEMENLKILYEESLAKETVTESMKFQAKDIDSIRKEFEEEMKFQKEENANLALQLKKTQESNIELVSILQELEETIQKQKMEIDSLSKLNSEFQVGASGLECDDARQKNSSKQDLTKVRKSSCDSDPEDSMFENSTKDLHMELELEKNSELNLQHQQLQELQKNLEGTIWYLERTLDDKNKETEVLLKKNKELEQGLTSQVLVKCETQWRDQLAEKEEKIAILEAKLFTAHDSQSLMEKGFENEGYHNLITENESLKEKVQELERDCNELTDENLELLFKLKESKKDVLTGSVCHKSSSQEDLDNVCKSGFELSKLKSQLDETERQQTKKITVKGFSADYLQVQDVDLKNKCADLEIQLGALKDKASYLDCELCKWRARAEEQENQICELQQKLECYQAKETELKVLPSDVSPDSVENSKLLSELHEQIQLTLSNAKKWCFALSSPTKSECSFRSDDSEISITTDALTQKEQIEIILKNFSQLKELLKEKTCGINNGKEVQTTVVNSVEILNELEVHTSDQGQENLNEIPDDEETNPDKELTGKISEINKLKSDNVLKEEEVEALTRCQQEYESQISNLQKEKTVLEASIQEVQGRLKLSESNFAAHQMESETKIQELTGELVASKHNQEVLMADHEKLLNLLEDVKSNEEKLKTTVRGLDLKAKASEYERLQLVEEISSLNVQLQKTALLQDEILSLKRMLNEVKLENERLKASLQILSRDHEEIQAERTLFVQKISVNQNAISELENCKNRKVALEEKLLRLEGDLAAREAQGSQEAALKNELARIRRENSRFQRKMKCLQEEKEECMRRVQALEEELKLKKTVDQDLSKSCNSVLSPYPECDCARTSTNGDCNLSMVDDNEQSLGARNSQSTEIDPLLKIQSLENELAEALEANDMYKSQLKSMLSQVPSSHLEIPMTSTIEDGMANKEGYEHKVSYLEAELRDLRERYLQMSIKYAEVEDQKEQLVLKLKAGKNRRSWFS
ncbi:golgin subfamily A member 4-like [Carica papaya]|uniref:golgin subfamily A member 4-like n=1 Tax=Carica papaya TaxID=3649 RepID=UPI000B8D0E18|nr:golgin subfamily A member 4-like [Carica papaya]